MALIKLMPEQVMHHWDSIRDCISTALPPHVYESDNTLVNIQEQLLVGNLECWILASDYTGRHIYGVATTRFSYESGTKNLLVYTIAMVREHPVEIWKDVVEVICKYGRAKGCANVIAFSDNPKVWRIAEHTGADVSYRLIQYPLMES